MESKWKNIGFGVLLGIAILFFLCQIPVALSRAACVVGCSKFSNNSAYTAGIDGRFRAWTGGQHRTPPSQQNFSTYVRKQRLSQYSAGQAAIRQADLYAQGLINSSKLSDAPSDGFLYARLNGAWSSVVSYISSLFHGLEVTWAEITGKPSTYPPSSHGHATSDVTGLDAALAAKLAASHFGDYSGHRALEARATYIHWSSVVQQLRIQFVTKTQQSQYSAARTVEALQYVKKRQSATLGNISSLGYIQANSGLVAGIPGIRNSYFYLHPSSMAAQTYNANAYPWADPSVAPGIRFSFLGKNDTYGNPTGGYAGWIDAPYDQVNGGMLNFSVYPIDAASPTDVMKIDKNGVKVLGNFSAGSIKPQQAPSDWNASTGPTRILNKPSIPTAQVPSDWASVINPTQILNKPTIPVACGTDPSTAIFDGAEGPFCNISGITRSHVYNSAGTSPTPSPTPFVVQLWQGGKRLAIQTWKWWTGGSANNFFGSGTGSTFTGSLQSTWTANNNNYLAVQVTYSTVYGRNKGYCQTGAPIAVTRNYSGAKGNTGPYVAFTVGTVTKVAAGGNPFFNLSSIGGNPLFERMNVGIVTGDPGSSSVTQAQILTELAKYSAPNNGTLQLQGETSSQVKFKMLYTSGGTSFYITENGLIYALDTNGKLVWGWDNVNKFMKFSNWSVASTRLNMTIDQKGQIHRYATDGKTLIYELHTSGRQKNYNRVNGKLMEEIRPDGTQLFYKTDGVTPRFTNNTSTVIISKWAPKKFPIWIAKL